jgi:hypothetical protein
MNKDSNTSRDNTFFDVSILNNETISGIRHVSMGSISLLQMLNNPFVSVMLNGAEIPIENVTAMLEFVYLHTQPIEQVTKEVLQSRLKPEQWTEKIVMFGLNLTIDDIVVFIQDIMRDRDNINNSKTKSISQSKGQSKNEQPQV